MGQNKETRGEAQPTPRAETHTRLTVYTHGTSTAVLGQLLPREADVDLLCLVGSPTHGFHHVVWTQFCHCSRGCAHPRWVFSVSVRLDSGRGEGLAKLLLVWHESQCEVHGLQYFCSIVPLFPSAGIGHPAVLGV